ncbi:16S rRNA (guanine(527)-N(7))-methyltransferase RsmG [Gloeobacter violaceus]|uniref:Ribosomal RNA small subunit methyltransferase G n=1 Tax=Gloeobacter violaceus (strain ATCC 29082 / PCC 7421) TaxID=251221 RepID=RSMG_GLOVI|nr:16S rRNA (guanine(527)-N(7))-methyltransferase RsmG [Gloeobacter violaceus]Q7NMQ7.1 RecName: Full=Ribosomal RNA small subunit methyltransferase G; AltName: Full=16S rRNA 7-methylguanosine methyltransferase; Short=16S rRNA m7G methyltransferase [Gloeobacter violaceus PCC 7421]BAC88649.1 glucose inhibited division protein B [Gloeobacter violaceus PCC 7421]
MDSGALWQDLGWQPDTLQARSFERLYALVLAGNTRLNLTRITGREEFWEKHLFDSLRGLAAFQDQKEPSLIDIGTGAGFPGLPIAIAHPDWYVVLVDSVRKKIAFVLSTIQALGLTNAQALTGRAEDLAHRREHRESYDLAVLRAVAQANVCAEYALPFVKLGGAAVLYRGNWEVQEEVELARACRALGGEIVEVDAFELPVSRAVRHCVVIRKTGPGLRVFPRPAGLPTQHPLGAIEGAPRVESEEPEEP